MRLTQKGHASLDCAITCHHVLRPTREEDHTTAPSEPPPQYDPVLDKRGHFHRAVLMDSQPSLKDHMRYLERSQKAVDSYHEQIKKAEKERDAGFDSSNLRRRLSRMQEFVASMITTSKIPKQFDRVFGHTLATSGYIRACAGCLLDWGLVVVRPSRLGQNVW